MQKTKKETFTMKISYDIGDAKKDYPGMYHVISSNEVHSFDTYSGAKNDFIEATHAEFKIGNGFSPLFIHPFQPIPDAKD